MKKKHFDPSLLNRNHLPNMVSRRIFGSHRSGRFITAAYKSDAGGSATTDEDKRTEEELLLKIEQRVSKALAGVATPEQIEEIRSAQKKELEGIDMEQLRAMADDKTGVMAKLAKQGLELQQLRGQMQQQAGERPLTIRQQVEKWQKDNKDAIVKIRDGERNVSLPALNLNLRAVASPMTPATVNPTGSPYIGRVEVEPGINDFLRAAPTFWDYLVKGRTNATTYVWVNKTNPQGAAAFIGPGVPKPGVSFEMVAENSTVKKIADSAKAATELLADIDGMTTFIEQELRYAVMIKVNSQLMSGVASSTAPAGIQTLSTTYTLTSIKTPNANYMDAIRAVVAQLRSGYLTGEITVFINPIDSANMDLTKATTAGTYLLPPFVTANGKTIAGARIVEDANVPVGRIQAGFLRYFRILIYEDFNVSWGWENDDFTRNLVTAVGEMRLHQFFNTIHTGAFIYDTFAHVISLMTP